MATSFDLSFALGKAWIACVSPNQPHPNPPDQKKPRIQDLFRLELTHGAIKMHRNQIWAAIFGTFVVGLGAAVSVQAAPRQRACAEIRAACEQAGFVQGGARSGNGVFVDCIVPIMRGTPQPRRASRPLPPINLQLVADCKALNPNFGQRNALPSQAGQPPVEASPLPRGATPQVAPARQRNAPPAQEVEPPVQVSPPQPAAIPQPAPALQTNDGGIGQE
jgi:hypothetical protein